LQTCLLPPSGVAGCGEKNFLNETIVFAVVWVVEFATDGFRKLQKLRFKAVALHAEVNRMGSWSVASGSLLKRKTQRQGLSVETLNRLNFNRPVGAADFQKTVQVPIDLDADGSDGRGSVRILQYRDAIVLLGG